MTGLRQTVPSNRSVSAASSTFGIRMERAESESVYFSIPADFRQTAETPYVRCFRCLCIHLPRLPVLDGSSCPGSRFTAHTPRLPTSIFVHCNIKTLYYQLLGYHTIRIIFDKMESGYFSNQSDNRFFINSDNRGETSRKSGRPQSIKGSSGFFCTFCCCLSRVQNSHRRRRLAAALPYFFSAFAFSRLIWRRFLTASSIGWISPAACRAILVSSGPTSS